MTPLLDDQAGHRILFGRIAAETPSVFRGDRAIRSNKNAVVP
jgi:hypothetical protein